MKKISMSLMGLALLAILLIAPAAHATSTSILYTETALDEGFWQYDFTVQNTSSMEDSHPYLRDVALDFEEYANITILTSPEHWTIGSFTSSFDLNNTDYLEMYSEATEFDVLPGALLAFSFKADYRLGEISYIAGFSDHGTIEDWTSISGTASPVPEPATCWLLGFGLIGLAGVCRKTDR